MKKEKVYFDLSIDDLRVLGGWAADCAERVLPIYEARHPEDPRPRAAIEGIRLFAAGGKRAAKLRVLAMDAYRAARESDDSAASAAAQAASLAASSAYTHPLVDVRQTGHILGPAAYAALAEQITHGNDAAVGDAFARWAVERVPAEVCGILVNMPAREVGKTRVERLMYDLDVGLRGCV